MKRFLNSVHATPTDKKDGDDRGVAVVTRRRLRPNLCPVCGRELIRRKTFDICPNTSLTAVPVLADSCNSKPSTRQRGEARESTIEEGLAPHNADSCGGSRKPLSGSKEIRQSRDTSEGSPAMAATCCAFEKRHEESPPAQNPLRSPQFQAFLDSLEPQYPKRKKLIQNWATSHFNHVL